MTCPPVAAPTTRDNSQARRCLVDAIDRSGIPRKAIAQDVLGRDDEPQFSKMCTGTRPFDIDELEKLPRAVLVAWLKALCAGVGLTEPREQDLADVADDLLKQIERLYQIARLARIRRPSAAKARLR